jgi:hypothetical protein
MKAPGFNAWPFKWRTGFGFQAFAFKCNLYRYTTGMDGKGAGRALPPALAPAVAPRTPLRGNREPASSTETSFPHAADEDEYDEDEEVWLPRLN